MYYAMLSDMILYHIVLCFVLLHPSTSLLKYSLYHVMLVLQYTTLYIYIVVVVIIIIIVFIVF